MPGSDDSRRAAAFDQVARRLDPPCLAKIAERRRHAPGTTGAEAPPVGRPSSAARRRLRTAAPAHRARGRPTPHSPQRPIRPNSARALRAAGCRPSPHRPRPHPPRPRTSATGCGCRNCRARAPRTLHRTARETHSPSRSPPPMRSADRPPGPRSRRASGRCSAPGTSRSNRAADCRRPRSGGSREPAATTAPPPATRHSYIRSPTAAPCRRHACSGARSGRSPRSRFRRRASSRTAAGSAGHRSMPEPSGRPAAAPRAPWA